MNLWQRIKVATRILLASFEAARQTTHTSRRGHRGPQDARFSVTQSSRTIIAEKAKEFENDNAIAQRIGSVFVDYTVGANGLVLIPNSSDQNWNAAAKKYWQTTQNFIDIRSRQNFGVIQGLIAWRWMFDGEIFLLKTRETINGKTYPRIQLIEYFLVATPPSRLRDEGKTIVDGVEIDPATGRPTGYWVRESSTATEFRLIDAQFIIHVFEPSRPGQYRGMSMWHAAINYLHRLDDLQEMEFRAVADAAEKSTFVKTLNGEMPESMRSIRTDGFNQGQPISQIDPTQRSDDLREAVGGRTAALFLGEDVVQFPGARPSEATRQLWSYLTSCVCAAIGIPKMICFSEWLDKFQGTIARGDYDIAAQYFRSRSAVLASAFREVYIYCISTGMKSDATIADKPGDGSWVNVTVRPPRAVNVDVGRNMNAEVAAMENGLTNYDLYYSPLGLDWAEEITKLADQVAFINRLAKERGLEPAELRKQAEAVMKAEQVVPAETEEDEEEVTA